MIRSTLDFVMQQTDEPKVLRSKNEWCDDSSPESIFKSCNNTMKMYKSYTSGRSWADRTEEMEEKEAKKYCSQAGSKSNSCNNDKENQGIMASKWVVRPVEKDQRKLETRQRQINIGKETVGYKKYTSEVRRYDRTQDHPHTPNKYTVCSTRSWQGTVRVWRRKLHYWDTPEVARSQQQKFANILTSPYMFEEDNSDDNYNAEESSSSSQ